MDESNDILNRKIVEYAAAVIKDRPCFHTALAIDISPFCDCHADNIMPIVPNIGMFASFDPVALDKACVDAVNRQPPMKGSIIDGSSAKDRFTGAHPATDWRSMIEHAEKMGLGTADYNMIKVK